MFKWIYKLPGDQKRYNKKLLKEGIARARELGYEDIVEEGKSIPVDDFDAVNDYNLFTLGLAGFRRFQPDQNSISYTLAKRILVNEEGLSFKERWTKLVSMGATRPVTYDFFTGLEELTLDPDSLARINHRGVEVGGFSVPQREGNSGVLGLTFEAEGTKTALSFKEYPSAQQLGKWHSHPYVNGKLTHPIPSGMDFWNPMFGGHMRFNDHPHLIVAPEEARLYFPEFLGEIAGQGIRDRMVPYSTQDRILELLTLGFFPHNPVLNDKMEPGKAYISFEV
tara:strand:+ start:2638 stop:3477 length:840 start_codon:yes stop_codon:yes gene_type:complete